MDTLFRVSKRIPILSEMEFHFYEKIYTLKGWLLVWSPSYGALRASPWSSAKADKPSSPFS
jgi:hypothetical protein